MLFINNKVEESVIYILVDVQNNKRKTITFNEKSGNERKNKNNIQI